MYSSTYPAVTGLRGTATSHSNRLAATMAYDVRSDSQLGSAKPRPRVHLVDGRLFVYDAESAASLLSDHRIWAAPVGVRRARNKSPEHNLPCVLSREQATLVLRKNLADTYLSGRPCDIFGGGDEDGVRPISDELAVAHGDRGTVAGASAAGAAAGAAAGSTAGTTADTTATATTSSRTHISAEAAAAAAAEEEPARARVQWKYPDTPAEKKSMAVFEDLWARGFCVASGSSYGADYVVYDGPPTESHSVAAVIVGRGLNDELSPTEVSGFARVQQAVAKAAVIATAPSQPVVAAEAAAAAGAAAAGAAAAEAAAVAPGEGSSNTVGGGGRASRSAGREEGVRYVMLQFHSVSSRE